MATGAKKDLVIKDVKGVQIYDSRNTPTVCCRMTLSDGKIVEFKVPSGASTGEKEACEDRDGGTRWFGKGVLTPANKINTIIADRLSGFKLNKTTQKQMDELLIDIDGTENKRNLGANAILAVSGAYSLALSYSLGVEPWQMLSSGKAVLPVPMFNVLNAGKHADSGFEVQETMIVPVGATSFAHAMEMGTDVWHSLKSMLQKIPMPTGRGDEGGFVNPFKNIDDTAKFVIEAIEKAKYKPGRQIALAFDAAFSEINGKRLVDKHAEPYFNTYHFMGQILGPSEIVGFWEETRAKYPIISIEDGMGERDRAGWKLLTKKLNFTTQLVLDDYICTNPKILKSAIEDGIGNASLIKLNQIGTVTETIKTMGYGRNAARPNIISHRSGETEDDYIGHFAMHPFVDQIKSGSSGSDRNAKYNRLLIIESELGANAKYAGLDAFPQPVADNWRKSY